MTQIINKGPPATESAGLDVIRRMDRRPVPHINHTVALAHAASSIKNALMPSDLKPMHNPMDVHQVREALQGVAAWFDDPNFYFPDDPDGEIKAVDYLVLLATLLREHLRAGNYV